MEYSIGDVVKVLDYGSRAGNQEYINKVHGKWFFLTSDLPFNIDNKINNTSYHSCNDKYANVEWKIIDYTIGSADRVIFRLRTRNKEDMLFIYCKGDASLHLVRKSKKRNI